MSSAADDETSLLEVIRGQLGKYTLKARVGANMYPVTSYILKNVTALRLDDSKMAVAIISDERVSESTVAELDFERFEFDDLSYILKKIEPAFSIEMDGHEFALSLLRILRARRPRDGKFYTTNFILVGPLAAFAVTHGIWLLVLKFICADSSEEDIMMVIKRVEGLFINLRRHLGKEETDYHPDFYIYISLLSSSVTRMPRDNWESMDSLYNLIKAMFEVISAAHLFLKDVYEFIPKSLKDDFDSLMLLSMYWVTRGVVACSSECNKLPKNRFVIQDSQKLSHICDKLIFIHKRLQILENNGKQFMDDEKIANAYQIPNKSGRTINFALMALFGLQTKESEDLVLAHSSKKNVNLSEATLGCKMVVLLISGLDLSPNVILYLIDIYIESLTSKNDCEFIWLPIHSDEWSASLEEQYMKLSQMMPWYTVRHPKLIAVETKKFIADIWKFQRKPIMVVVNEDGDVVCPNAIHMMNIWRAKAFPCTRMRERTLWKDETRVDSLVLGFDANISSMLEASKWVILYGGMDVEWIRKFITCIQGISADSGKFIEMIYAGKNAQSEKMRELISSSVSINTPRSYMLDAKKKWYFWTRLESILISRYQTVTPSDYKTDSIFPEVKKLLSYASAESWACLITPYSDLLIHGLGDTMLQGFMDYDLWKQHLSRKDFPKIFFDHMEQLRQSRMFDHPCRRIVLNVDNKDVVQSLGCPHCNYLMEKKIQYRCCHTDDDDDLE